MKGVGLMQIEQIEQNELRERLKQFIKNTGTTQSFVCRKLKIPNSVLSLFINKDKQLYTAHSIDLNIFLKSRGY